ncbi:MAG: carboxylating nicotinate-nucleotide diphosphorylase [Bacteroidota bacterium]
MSFTASIDLDSLIARALAEDVASGDVTTLATIPADRQATATFLVKDDGVLAGCRVAERVFDAVDPALAVAWAAHDGDRVVAGTRAGEVTGAARSILTAERLALNLMQRMSGIATATRQMVDAARTTNPTVEILDTRKTAPGLRLLDKEAVRLGGGTNHRVGLYDMVLIKDNHIEAAGGLAEALRAAHAYLHAQALDLEVEVEVRTLDEVDALVALIDGGLRVDRALLDNLVVRHDDGSFDTTRLAKAVQRMAGSTHTEASGNVTLDSVAQIAATGVTHISSGALTHSVRALDVSLKVGLR